MRANPSGYTGTGYGYTPTTKFDRLTNPGPYDPTAQAFNPNSTAQTGGEQTQNTLTTGVLRTTSGAPATSPPQPIDVGALPAFPIGGAPGVQPVPVKATPPIAINPGGVARWFQSHPFGLTGPFKIGVL